MWRSYTYCCKMKIMLSILISLFSSSVLAIDDDIFILKESKEDKRNKFLMDFVKANLKNNGWFHVMGIGNITDTFYFTMNNLHITISSSNPQQMNHDLSDNVPYASSVVVLHCLDFNDFEQAFRRAMSLPFWHPHAHLILYFPEDEELDIPKIFMIVWFYKACNAIILQYNDENETMSPFIYSPYISDDYKLSHHFGCWKTTKIGRAVRNYRDGFFCTQDCRNVSLHSKLRNLYMGTCIGYKKYQVSYDEVDILNNLNLFEDKGRNLHGFVFRSYAGEALPFVEIEDLHDGTYALKSRDGTIWNEASQIMNFRIDLNASKETLKNPFNFEVNIQLIFSFARREADMILYPVYLFDLVVVDLDMSKSYKESGVCIISTRAGFETILFDVKLLQENKELVIRFFLCFNLIWLTYFIFNVTEKGRISFDQAGKDFVNAIRNVLSISPHRPPQFQSFRVYLFVSMWSFFVINFSTQAAIISFFSVHKRGKDVDTFEDVIEKGYMIEGMASPDMMLPDTEERFRIFNSRLVSINNLYDCVDSMKNDSHRFCLIDCSVGRYLARNRLNEKGEQYFHIAKDRIHGHHLCMLFHKHSPLTKTFNKCLTMFFEAGLILKWEKFRFNELKPYVPVQPLSLDDLIGIFKVYYIFLGLSFLVFTLEIIIHSMKRLLKYSIAKFFMWRNNRKTKMEQLKINKKKKKVNSL